MALSNGYGVLAATLQSHSRDQPDTQGRWYHVNLVVNAAGSTYRVAVDVDSKQSATGVQWKLIAAAPADLGVVRGQSPGYVQLGATSSSGALDFIRSHLTALWRFTWVKVKVLWFTIWFPVIRYQPWRSGSHLDASVALESILSIGAPIFVWGEPFTSGLGMHNVHQNQGDPAGSRWWDENGIWQDGGIAVLLSPTNIRYFVSKFSTQSATTDGNGHPA